MHAQEVAPVDASNNDGIDSDAFQNGDENPTPEILDTRLADYLLGSKATHPDR